MTASIGRNLNDIEKQYDLLSGLFSKKSVCGISDNSFFATLINATDSMAIKLSENQMVKVNTPFVKTGKQDIAVSVEDNRGRSLTDVILNVADSMAIKLTDDEIAAIIKNMTAEKPQSIEKNKQEFVLNNNYGMIFPVATMSKEVLSFLKAISPDTSNNTQKIVTKTETETLIASEGETDTSREIIKGIMIRITPVEVEFAGNDKTGPSINVFSLKEDHSSEGENGDIDKFFFLPVEQNVNGVFNSATFILNVVKKVLSEISITEYPGINEEVKRNLYGLEKINTKKINLASVLPEINIPDVSVEKNMIFMDINTNTRQPTEVDKSHNADLSLQKNDNFKAWNKSVTFDGNNFVPVLNNMVFFEDNKIAVFQNTDEINPQQLFTLQGQVKNSSAMYPEHKETATGIIEGLQDVEGLQDAGAEKNITAVPLVIPSKEAVGTEIKTVKAFYITAQNADLSPVDNDNSAKKGYTRQPTEVDKSHNADLSLQKNDNFKAWNKSVTFDGNNFVPVLNNMVFFEDNKIAVFQNTDEINPQQLFTLQGQVKNSSAMYPEHKETATGIIEGLQDVEGLQDAGAEKNITAVPLVIPSKEAVGTEIKTVKAFYITAQNADLSPVDNDNSAKKGYTRQPTEVDKSHNADLSLQKNDNFKAWNKSVTFDGNNFVPVLNNMVFFEDNKIAVFQNTDEINPQQLFTLQGQVKNSSAMYPEHKETATGIIEGLQDVEGLQDAGAEKNITAVPLVIPSKEAVGTEIKTVKAFYITAQNADLSPVDNDNSAKNPLEKNKTVLDSSALLTESFLEIERSDDIERELFANPLKDIFITNQEDGEIIQHLGQVRNEETINVENSVIQQRGVWQTAVSEKIQETIDRFIEARPAPVTTIRINIEGKESFVLGLTDNRNDIAVEIKVSDPELTSVINTVKEQIIKNLEARDIKVSVYINPDNQQQQKERHKWGYNDPEQDEKSLNGDKMNFSNILKINNQGENHVGISSTEYNKFNGFKPGLFRS